MNGSSYRRPVSGIERGYLNSATQGAHPTIHLVLEGVGHLDAAALHAAVEASCEANPGLAVTRRGPMWLGGGPLPAVIAHAGPLVDVNDVAEFHRDLDVVTGPVAEVHLFGGPQPAVVVRASHCVTDGRGLEHWLRDVFRILGGEQPQGAPDTEVDRHFVHHSDAVRPPRSADAGAPFVTSLAEPLLGGTVTEGRIYWVRRTVSGSATAMSARIAAAVAELAGHESTVVVPVDLRRHDRSVRSTANLSAQLPLHVEPGEDWRKIQARLLAQLARRAELEALRGDFRRSNPFAATLADAQSVGRDGRRPCAAVISDHGQLDLVPYGTADFVPTRLSTLPLLVSHVSTFISCFASQGSTHLTLACRATDDQARVTRLLDLVERSIPAPTALAPSGAR